MGRNRPFTAVVTGATSGIGVAVARGLRADGGSLLLTGRRSAHPLPGDASTYLPGDLDDESFVQELAETAARKFGGVNRLVIGHGLQAAAPLIETSAGMARDLLSANLTSAFLVMKHLVPLLEPAGPDAPSVVCISSRLGMVGIAGETLYSAAKGGLIMLAKGAAIELAARGIRVNVVAPGLTETDTVLEEIAAHHDPAGYRQQREAAIPLRRLAGAEEVAEAVLFLSSPRASYVTGAVLPVDGGYTAG